MKANGAPEKIYFDGESKACKLPIFSSQNIEYTRTDTFIKKACEWIKESITNNPECNRIISKKGVITMGLLIEDFRKYMKE